MKRFLAIACLSALAGCSIGPTTMTGPDGTSFQRVKCNISPAQCLADASEACGGGSYQVLQSESHYGGLLGDPIPGPVKWYTMHFQCGPSDGKLPEFETRW